jgi:rod shape-determining protein MreC
MEERRGTVLFVGLILLHLVAISHQVDRGGVSLLERAIFAVLSPVQNGVGATVHTFKSTWLGYVDLRGVRNDNARLRERNRYLEVALQEKQDMAREAERLRQVLELQQMLPMQTTVAQVVARDGVPWFRTFTINKGSNHGIVLDAPVLAPTGVLGRVIGVGPRAAKVQLLLDRQASVGVRIRRTGVTGLTEGQVGLADAGSNRELILRYVPSLADVVVGDEVVTAGLDQIFQKGLMVGRVSRVVTPPGLFKEIYVTPSAQFEQVEEVLVVKPPSSEPIEITEERGRREAVR